MEGVVMAEVAGEPQPLELRGGDAPQMVTVKQAAVSARTETKWLWYDLP